MEDTWWILAQAESWVFHELEREPKTLRPLFNDLTSNFEGNTATAIKKRRKTVKLVVLIRLLAHSLMAFLWGQISLLSSRKNEPCQTYVTWADPCSKLQAPSSKLQDLLLGGCDDSNKKLVNLSVALSDKVFGRMSRHSRWRRRPRHRQSIHGAHSKFYQDD